MDRKQTFRVPDATVRLRGTVYDTNITHPKYPLKSHNSTILLGNVMHETNPICWVKKLHSISYIYSSAKGFARLKVEPQTCEPGG